MVELSAECVVENALLQVFGSEWSALSESDRAVIVRDCTEEGGVSDLGAYRRNIGAGNLFRYVLTQRRQGLLRLCLTVLTVKAFTAEISTRICRYRFRRVYETLHPSSTSEPGSYTRFPDSAPIGLDVFLECHAFDGSFRLLNQRDTRPATVADWNRQERGN